MKHMSQRLNAQRSVQADWPLLRYRSGNAGGLT